MKVCRASRFQSQTFFNAEAYLHDVRHARHHPNEFWMQKASRVSWYRAPTQAVPSQQEPRVWFPDGQLNSCFLAVDSHVERGLGGLDALAWESSITGAKHTLTYAQLQQQTSQFALVLKSLGVQKGDCVLIYMPNILQGVITMLASARIGAPHCVVFAGFAPETLAGRIEHTKPKVIVTASHSMEGHKRISLLPLVEKALEVCKHKPKVVCFDRGESWTQDQSGGHKFVDWNTEMKRVEREPLLEPVPLSAKDPLYILHTSGTTGQPKGLIRDNGSHAVAITSAGHDLMGLRSPGQTMWAASDIGWVVGHSFSVYAPLFSGAKSLFVEGKPVGTPDALEWFRIIERQNVNTMFCAPTAIRAIRKELTHAADHVHKFNLYGLRAWFLAGEKCDTPTFTWLSRLLPSVAVCDNWWQTETGWPITSRGFLGSYGVAPYHEGSAGLPCPGYDLHLSDRQDVLLKLPLPPGFATGFLGDADGSKFQDKYFSEHAGSYTSGDSGQISEDGHVTILARVDDVINVAGHRLTTGQLEEAVSQTPGVAECAVVAKVDSLKGHVPVAFVVGQANAADVIEMVREKVGAVASLREVHFVAKLPKTRSGKTLRNSLREIVDGETFIKIPPTIEDEDVLKQVHEVVRAANKRHHTKT